MTTDPIALAVSSGLRAALGDYRLVAEIGRGGMANVFLALSRKGDGVSRPVVLKQLRSDLTRQDDFRAMFANEAFLARRFQHKNVVETYDLYADRHLCVLMMEFLDGQTLARVRQRGIQVPFSIQLRALAEALAGLHYLHELTDEEGKPFGIVHRDVTPSNIFVTYDGQVKVVDFGIAKATVRDTETRMSGVVKGKLGYMSPEAVRSEYLDRRTDIFSVGVMLWEAATGQRLWQEHDEIAVFRRLAAGDLPIRVAGAQGTGAEMLRIAERALAVDPVRRYATAEEMREELVDLMARIGKTTHATALAGYMEAFFSAERQKFQAVLAEAQAQFPSRSVSQSRMHRNEVSASYPGVESTEHATMISSLPARGGPFRTARAWYEVVKDRIGLPHFRPDMQRRFGFAFVVAAAAMGVAYAAHVPAGSPAPAAGTPITVEPTAMYDEAPSRVNPPAPALAQGSPTPPVTPEPSSYSMSQGPAPTARGRGTISAVFVVHPFQARLFLDGVPLEGNPAGIRRQPDDKPHLLRVEAPGYATLVRIVDLDRDVAKEFELAREAMPEVVAPRTAPSTEPHDELFKPRPARRVAVGHEDPWGI